MKRWSSAAKRLSDCAHQRAGPHHADYVVKLTKDATKCGPDDHVKLRAAGFDDRGILQITLIASWFNYIIAPPMHSAWPRLKLGGMVKRSLANNSSFCPGNTFSSNKQESEQRRKPLRFSSGCHAAGRAPLRPQQCAFGRNSCQKRWTGWPSLIRQ